MTYEGHLNIKSWAEEDRPREKLVLKGKGSLSDAELIAILIGSGNREETAVELSKKILNSFKNDLNNLGRAGIKDFMQFKGIGEAKAISIAAALELGRRRKEEPIKKKPKISTSIDAYNLISAHLSDLPHEEFWMLLLNRRNQVIEIKNISKGGVSGTVADAKLIFKTAIEGLASSVILCHNHPSGNLSPSQADIKLTEKLKQGGLSLDISVVDHIIVGDNDYLSFADKGFI